MNRRDESGSRKKEEHDVGEVMGEEEKRCRRNKA